MPAPIDISSALGADPGVGPAPAPGDSMDFGLDDPLAGLEPAEGEDLAAEELEDEDLALCQSIFPDWTPEQHQGLLDLIDQRLGGASEDE